MKKVLVAGFVTLSLLVMVVPQLTSAQVVIDTSTQSNPSATFTGPGGAPGGDAFTNFSAPSSASSASGSGACSLSGKGLNGVVGCIISVFNTLIYLMMAASIVYIVLGAFNMIRSEEKREEGKQTIYYGVIGLFVMISIWGLVNILDTTFGLSSVRSTQVIRSSLL
jgi:hypothetical protein